MPACLSSSSSYSFFTAAIQRKMVEEGKNFRADGKRKPCRMRCWHFQDIRVLPLTFAWMEKKMKSFFWCSDEFAIFVYFCMLNRRREQRRKFLFVFLSFGCRH
jgi:hypothetical protein